LPFKNLGGQNLKGSMSAIINNLARDRADTEVDSEVDKIRLDLINEDCNSNKNEGSNKLKEEMSSASPERKQPDLSFHQ